MLSVVSWSACCPITDPVAAATRIRPTTAGKLWRAPSSEFLTITDIDNLRFSRAQVPKNFDLTQIPVCVPQF